MRKAITLVRLWDVAQWRSKRLTSYTVKEVLGVRSIIPNSENMRASPLLQADVQHMLEQPSCFVPQAAMLLGDYLLPLGLGIFMKRRSPKQNWQAGHCRWVPPCQKKLLVL